MPENPEVTEARALVFKLARAAPLLLQRELTTEERAAVEMSSAIIEAIGPVMASPTPQNLIALALRFLDSEAFAKLLLALRAVNVKASEGTLAIAEGVPAEIDFER